MVDLKMSIKNTSKKSKSNLKHGSKRVMSEACAVTDFDPLNPNKKQHHSDLPCEDMAVVKQPSLCESKRET